MLVVAALLKQTNKKKTKTQQCILFPVKLMGSCHRHQNWKVQTHMLKTITSEKLKTQALYTVLHACGRQLGKYQKTANNLNHCH